jgi:hypothetical protein
MTTQSILDVAEFEFRHPHDQPDPTGGPPNGTPTNYFLDGYITENRSSIYLEIDGARRYKITCQLQPSGVFVGTDRGVTVCVARLSTGEYMGTWTELNIPIWVRILKA